MRQAAISTGPSTHIDHLAPLCEIMDIPLIVTEKEHFDLAKNFYPMIETKYLPYLDLTIEKLASFDSIITCGKFWAMELKSTIKEFFNKDLNVIFSPHGNSDKESRLPEYNRTINQDIFLVYGEQMRQEKEGENTIVMGNIRLNFYLKYKAHFDRLVPSFDTSKKTVLYAPTWDTEMSPTSFFESADKVIDSYCKKYNLVIKLHPLLERNSPASYYRIIAKNEDRAHFLIDFPPIYPLLEKTDIYLGDFSSIGYDFLYYNRPMFFLKDGGRLQQCGEVITPEDTIENSQDALKEIRKKMYRHAFGEKISPADPARLKNEIGKFIQQGRLLRR